MADYFIDLLIKFLSTVAPTVLTFAAGACCTWFWRQKAIENAVKCLLRDRILQAYNYHVMGRHSIQRDEYNAVMDMITAYSHLKGKNGYMEKIAKEYEESGIEGKEGMIL